VIIMRAPLKYFLIGLFFFSISYALQEYYLSYEVSIFSLALNISIAVAVGMLKTPKIGLVFGLSSIIPNLVDMFMVNNWYFSYFSYNYGLFFIISSIISTLLLCCFGYFPAKGFQKQNLISNAMKNLLGVLIFATIVYFVFFMLAFYSFENVLVMVSLGFVFGGIAVVSSGKYVAHRTIRQGMSMPINYPPPPSPSHLPLQNTQCANCGCMNHQEFDYCGNCGHRLKQDHTKIY
jgi:hypothetical protein